MNPQAPSSADAGSPRPSASDSPLRWLALGVPLALLSVVVLVWYAWLRIGPPAPTGPLPVIATLPDFSLTERSGRVVTLGDLAGKVWLADFIFTSCTGPCPELTLRMRSVQSGLQDHGDDVRLVSFSIDPEFDTLKVLTRFADRFGADPDRWWFLTGASRSDMHKLVMEGFLQAVSETGGTDRYVHSTRFVLIDRQGRIRAWYDGLEPESKALVLRDIDRLLAETAGP